MKLNLFGLGEKNQELMNQLPTFFEYWQAEIDRAEPVFDIKGQRLESLIRDVPQHQAHYAKLAQESRALVKWLEVQKAKSESRYIKNYNNSPRVLGVKEQSQYLNGEKDVIELNQLIVEAALKQNQFDEIVDAVKQLGWMLGAVVKLRVAELQDVII
jgi:hypothetical protein